MTIRQNSLDSPTPIHTHSKPKYSVHFVAPDDIYHGYRWSMTGPFTQTHFNEMALQSQAKIA